MLPEREYKVTFRHGNAIITFACNKVAGGECIVVIVQTYNQPVGTQLCISLYPSM